MAVHQEEVKLRLGVDASQVSSGLTGITQKISSFAKNVGGIFAGSFALSKALDAFRELDERIDSIKRTSEKSGLSQGFVQDLQNLGKLAGLSGEQIESIMDKMAKGLEQGENPEKKIRALANALSKTSDAGERARMAIDALGKSGVKLIPILSGGADEMERLANSMGKLSDQEIKDIDELNDRIEITKSKAQVLFAHAVQGAILQARALKYMWEQLQMEGEGFFIGGPKRAANRMIHDQVNEEVKKIKDAQTRADNEVTEHRGKNINKTFELFKRRVQELKDLQNSVWMDKMDRKAEEPPGPWIPIAGDPTKRGLADYYDKMGDRLGGYKNPYGKVFKDRARSMKDAEERKLADGTIQRRIIGEAFFDALEKSKETPQNVSIVSVKE